MKILWARLAEGCSGTGFSGPVDHGLGGGEGRIRNEKQHLCNRGLSFLQ